MSLLDRIMDWFHRKEYYRYGCLPDLPDHRDLMFKLEREPKIIAGLPASVDLRTICPPVVDQGAVGSCTACSIANAHRFDQKKQKFQPDWPPSRLFIYYNERAMEDTIYSDAGASIRDGIKSISQQGVCPETEWPYRTWKYTCKPSKSCYQHALKHIAVKYQRIDQHLDDLRQTLSLGYPIVCGISVYDSFESSTVSKTGDIPIPEKTESSLGGHAILLVGYIDSEQKFIFQNSWGEKWGKSGFGMLPYQYVLNSDLAYDFWVVELVK